MRLSYAVTQSGRMPSLRCLAPLLLLAPLLSVPLGSGSAEAGQACANGRPQRVVTERLGDSVRGVDITAAGLWHKPGDACIWTTISGRFGAQYAQAIQVLYDTDPRRAGAEYFAFAYSPRDGDDRRGGFVVKRVGNDYRRIDCPAYSFFRPGRDQVGLGVPKTCFGDPDSVRVKIQLWDIRDYLSGNRWRGEADQIPNRTWTRRF